MWTRWATAAIAASHVFHMRTGPCGTCSIARIARQRHWHSPVPRRPLHRTLQAQRPSPFPSACSAAPRGQPRVAFFLGLFPGLGAVYNGEYNKALIHIVVFAAIIVGLSSDPGDGGALTLSSSFSQASFLYMALMPMRTAKAKSLGESTTDPLEAWSKKPARGPDYSDRAWRALSSEQF